jgi:hypothetical protein
LPPGIPATGEKRPKPLLTGWRLYLAFCAALFLAERIGGDYLPRHPFAENWKLPVGPVVLVCLGLIVWVAVVSVRQERRRRGDLSRLAASLGWTFEANPRGSWAHWPRDFPDLHCLCPRGFEFLGVSNVLRGRRDDVEVITFDCTVGPRDSRSRGIPVTTVVCFRMPGKNLPWFYLEPHTMHTWVPARFWVPGVMGGGVRLDAVPEFSRDFLVSTCDYRPEAVRTLFTPEVQRLVANFDVQREWCVWGAGEWVCPRLQSKNNRGRVLLPGEYLDFIQRATAVADLYFGASR